MDSRPIKDVRLSELQPGQEWLLGDRWVRVVGVDAANPDGFVTIRYVVDGEEFETRRFHGYRRCLVAGR